MAHQNKRRLTDSMAKEGGQEQDDDNSSLSSADDASSDDGDDGENMNEEIQVDFEAQTPQDNDLPGIKRLLQQLFLQANINLSDLTDLILKQNYVGSVIKQSAPPEDDAEDDDDDVFGITTVINITDKKDVNCIRDLRTYLLSRCTQAAGDSVTSSLQKILDGETGHVGFIISERFVNIPSQIAVPLYTTLKKEIEAAHLKTHKFSFGHYILILKEHKAQLTNGRRNRHAPGDDIVYSNAEEELFLEDAELQYEFSVEGETDNAMGGDWDDDEDGVQMKPFRRVLVLPAHKLDVITRKIAESFPNT